MGWKKSSSSADGDCCVEVLIEERFVLVRNSFDPNGQIVAYTYPEWDAFIRGVKQGEFDL